MYKTVSTICAAIALICMAQSRIAFAQETESTASLQETLEWIKTKVEIKERWFQSQTPRSLLVYEENVRYDQCNFQWDQAVFRVHPPDPPGGAIPYWREEMRSHYKIKLSDLEPLSGKLSAHETWNGAWKLQFKTTGDRALILSWTQLRFWKTMEPSEQPIISYSVPEEAPHRSPGFEIFITTDKDLATRALRAFKHAIKLCGGKVEPF